METTLKFDTLVMSGADLSKTSPLPDIIGTVDLHTKVNYDDSLSEEDIKYLGYGSVKNILPYTMQNNYNREKKQKEFKTAVLENDFLKATFIPEFGGRLWSLFDKINNKELLYVNPVFQPANLALRNAWISGGVEWNIGTTGHTPLTLENLFVSEYTREDGSPGLKMFEWERIRQASYEIDAYLPKDSKFLFVKITIINTQKKEVPMYWWSNIAVPETKDTRVITPADSALYFDTKLIISKQDFPYNKDKDYSYSTNIEDSVDLFFKINKDRRKWITALNNEGYGLIQTSTDMLKGRKLFLWGNGDGGQNWQEFLSVENHNYVEIQAGLCTTQMEHLPMPAEGKFQWIEAYGAIQVDTNIVNGDNWKEVYTTIDNELEKNLPRKGVENQLRENKEDNLTMISTGSGWGTLEKMRLIANNEELPVGFENFSDEFITQKQNFWLKLLKEGKCEILNSKEYPAPYLVQEEWIFLLENAINSGEKNWHSYLQLGVGYCSKGKDKEGYIAFEKSLSEEENCWALTNMGLMHMKFGEYDKAFELLLRAVKILPEKNIVIECGKALMLAEKHNDFNDFLNLLPTEIQNHGRIKLMELESLINRNLLDEAKEMFLNGLVVSDIREGEVSLSDLWHLLHKKILINQGAKMDSDIDEKVKKEYPLPKMYNFKMNT